MCKQAQADEKGVPCSADHPIIISCPFCEMKITSPESDLIQSQVSNHVKTICPVIQRRPELLKQTVEGKRIPRNQQQGDQQESGDQQKPRPGDQQKSLLALHLQLQLAKHELDSFRRSRYKLEKFRGASLPVTNADNATVGILMTATAITFEGELGEMLATQAWSVMEHRLLSLPVTHGHRLHSVDVKSTQAVPMPKGRRPLFQARMNFYFSMQAEAFNSGVFQETSIEELELQAVNAVNSLQLLDNTGAVEYAIISQELLRNEDFFVHYKVTVPLSSSVKAAKILTEIWTSGGALIIAQPSSDAVGKQIQTPVQRAWITNFDVQELIHMNKKLQLSAVLQWILERVTGSDDSAGLIGQVATLCVMGCNLDACVTGNR